MIFYILLGVAAFFIACMGITGRKRKDGYAPWPIILSVFLLGLYLFMAILPMRVTSASTWLPGHWVINGEDSLAALNTGSSTSGSFFLGSGFIDEEMMYSYLTRSDGGVILPKQVPSYQVSIVETSKTEPIVQKYKYVYDPFLVPWTMETNTVFYMFYVPEGTVINSYNVNP